MTESTGQASALPAQLNVTFNAETLDRHALTPYHLRSSGIPVYQYKGRDVLAYVCCDRNAMVQSLGLIFEVESEDGSFTEVSSDELVEHLKTPHPLDHPRDQAKVRDERLDWEMEFEMFLATGILADELLMPMRTALEQYLSFQEYVVNPAPTSPAGMFRAIAGGKKGGAA